MRLAWNSLLVAFLLLCAYELAIARAYTGAPLSESQWIDNYRYAQEFVYGHSDASIVIVGSSLSTRLRSGLLPPGVYNLSLGGLSALDGLKIVLASNARPRRVFVEANVLNREANASFLARLLSPGLFSLRRHVFSFRDAARPAGLALTALNDGMKSLRRLLSTSQPSSPPTPLPQDAVSSIFDSMLLIQKRAAEVPMTASAQEKLAITLRGDIAALERRGAEIVFFELPVHPELCDAPAQSSIKRLLRVTFPKHEYVRIADCDEVKTGDGIHLTERSAELVTRRFAEILK